MKFLFLILVSLNAFANDFEKVTITNLDMDYTAPYGMGSVERVGMGMSLTTDPYPIEVRKTADSFEITTPYLDFTWKNPMQFIFNLESLSARKTNASLGTRPHVLESDYFRFRPKESGTYMGEKIKGRCDGNSEGDFRTRLLEDCRMSMDLVIKKIDFPENFFVYQLLQELPQLKTEDMPADNFVLSVKNGDYSLQLYLKYMGIYAGLRSWGHFAYENDHKTLAIRVDQVKYGHFNITRIVMKKLKEILKDPRIKVDPPWIRIELENKE